MHELGITRNIVAIVSEAAGGRRVKRVTLTVGTLAGVMSEAINFCFAIVAQGTPLEGAVLEIESIAARASCPACGEFAVATLFAACACGRRDVVRLRGDELKIKTIEIEEAC